MIQPSLELIRQWIDEWDLDPDAHCDQTGYVAAKAAHWAANQELEACCEWLEDVICDDPQDTAKELRAARRSKPSSLKEQALALVEQHEDGWRPSPKDWDTIRRALEQIDD